MSAADNVADQWHVATKFSIAWHEVAKARTAVRAVGKAVTGVPVPSADLEKLIMDLKRVASLIVDVGTALEAQAVDAELRELLTEATDD